MAALGWSDKSWSLGLSALLCLHRLAEPVALAIHLENVAVMAEPVEQRRRHPLPLEDLAPLAERQVRRHQQAAPLVAVGEDAEQQLHPAPAHRHVAQLVADQQVRLLELAQEPVQRVLLLLLLQPVHQLRRREEADSQASPTGGQAKSNRNMCLPCSVAAHQAAVELLVDPVATSQLEDL